jgi:hypothetical protein
MGIFTQLAVVNAYWQGFIFATVFQLLFAAGWFSIRAAIRKQREKKEFSTTKYLEEQAKKWRVLLRELTATGPLIVYNVVQDTIAFAIADDFFAAIVAGPKTRKISTPAGVKIRVARTITCAYKYRQIPIEKAVQRMAGSLLYTGGIPSGAWPEAEAAIFSKEERLFVPLPTSNEGTAVWEDPREVWQKMSDRVSEEITLRRCLNSPKTTIS